ncbi:hypothetical protein K438DRAFT_1986059 [Mycena galopus ATCC 62051]|nr:hypothetical protein K438DRAFT_1986059 [Mycena galopus ATCC 62051]
MGRAFFPRPHDPLPAPVPGLTGPNSLGLAREAGFKGLFAGLGPRMIMTAGLVASQFLMYGEIKRALHAPPGLEIHKED